MHRLGALALVGVVALWSVASGAEPGRASERWAPPSPRAAAPEPALGDEPETADGLDDAAPGDDELDEGRALPSEPTVRPLPGHAIPRGEDEEPPPPGGTAPNRFHAAEPAGAAQPLPPE
jgi:hypothetical protein